MIDAPDRAHTEKSLFQEAPQSHYRSSKLCLIKVGAAVLFLSHDCGVACLSARQETHDRNE